VRSISLTEAELSPLVNELNCFGTIGIANVMDSFALVEESNNPMRLRIPNTDGYGEVFFPVDARFVQEAGGWSLLH
jgi:hypothetical protein